jgi:hypothetical protein
VIQQAVALGRRKGLLGKSRQQIRVRMRALGQTYARQWPDRPRSP